MIGDDERTWKAAIEERIQNDRGKAFRRHFSAFALLVVLIPLAIAGPVAVTALIRASDQQGVFQILGTLFWIYFAILLWSLPVLLPVGLSHVFCVALLYGRGHLNWLSAAGAGFIHGVAAALLVAAFYG